LNLYFLCGVERNLLKINKKSSTVFEKKIKRWKIFYKKIETKSKKIIFVKLVPKRFAPKWTSNKMGNTKKGHNKTGRDKVVAPKRHASSSTLLPLVHADTPFKKSEIFAPKV